MQQPSLSYITAILWVIISTILFTLPGSALPKEDWFDKIWLDKWVHIAIFFIMVFLWFRVFERNKNNLLLISLYALIYGIGIEFIQEYFIKNRSFDLKDIAADMIGCGIGFVFCRRRYIKK